jgi:hypothetical protein
MPDAGKIIDLTMAAEVDGTPLYTTPLDAAKLHLLYGAAWLCVNHPQTVLQALGLAAVTGISIWLAYEPPPKPRRRRPNMPPQDRSGRGRSHD